MIKGQFVLVAAILAGEAITQKHIKAGEGGVAGRPDIGFQCNDTRERHSHAWACDLSLIRREDVDPV